MDINKYCADMTRLSDAREMMDLTDPSNWRVDREGVYASHMSVYGDPSRSRFTIKPVGSKRAAWDVRDTVIKCWTRRFSLNECFEWAQEEARAWARYKKEAYRPGTRAATSEGDNLLIEEIFEGEAVNSCRCSVLYHHELPHVLVEDISSLYIRCSDAEKNFACWTQKTPLTKEMFDRAAEEETRRAYRQLTELLIEKGLTISTMESMTGGQIASLITDTEGSSKVIKGAFVTYSNEAKVLQGVPKEVIDRYTVYSRETAAAMAEACRKAYGSDLGIGVTGTAGNHDPSNPETEELGSVYIAVARAEGKTVTVHMNIPHGENRHMYKLAAADRVRETVMNVLDEVEKKMKKVCVRAYPYATQEAEFMVPAGLSPEEEHAFIEEHFKDIRFGAPDLDYKGTDFEYFDAD